MKLKVVSGRGQLISAVRYQRNLDLELRLLRYPSGLHSMPSPTPASSGHFIGLSTCKVFLSIFFFLQGSNAELCSGTRTLSIREFKRSLPTPELERCGKRRGNFRRQSGTFWIRRDQKTRSRKAVYDEISLGSETRGCLPCLTHRPRGRFSILWENGPSGVFLTMRIQGIS